MSEIPNHEADPSKSKPIRVFVELGSGTMPVPAVGTQKFVGNDIYIAIDMDKDNLNSGRALTERRDKFGQNIHFMQADGIRLPLPDSSVDELALTNLLGESTTMRGRPAILHEILRVLKAGAQLTLLETNTPFDPKIYEGTEQTPEEMLADAGFEVVKSVRYGEDEWEHTATPYNQGRAYPFAKDSYIVIAKKPR